jgi:hypothetical protein
VTETMETTVQRGGVLPKVTQDQWQTQLTLTKTKALLPLLPSLFSPCLPAEISPL